MVFFIDTCRSDLKNLSEILACFILELCIQGSHFRKSTISNLISLVLLKNYNQQVMGLNKGALVVFLLIVSSFCAEFMSAIDTITSTESVKDPQAILSNGGVYKLGFFSPVNSTNRYIGIWYNQIPVPTPLWVANRNMPLRDSSGILAISKDGNLILSNGQRHILWSSNVSNLFSNTSAQLTDSGNLVLKENGNGTILWDSFQHPSDTLFSRMKITANKRTGESVQLTSWKSPSDPSVGSFSASLNLRSTQEIFIWKDGNPYFRSGPWNRQLFIGVPYMNSAGVDGLNLVDEGDGSVYLSFSYVNQSFLWSFVLNSQGQFEETRWEEGMEKQNVLWQVPQFDCPLYGYCGAFGSCNLQKSPPICECLRGFEPKSIDEWSRGNWTSGCMRKKSLQCQTGKPEGFLRLANMKVPDFIEWSRVTEDKCREDCLTNCSCIAYAYGTGVFCMSWSGNLIDLQKFPQGGVDLYIRSEYSEVDAGWKERAIIMIAVVLGSISITICAFFLWRLMISRQRARKGKVEETLLFDTSKARSTDLNQAKFQELPLFSFHALAAATNNFNTSHKLGQGGFGIVYKGTLPDGQEIAVKRLSRTSGQGLEEFMNEVVVISKLQHRNLVRLHGCCAEGEEKMLVYEYMPNKSLDAFLFDVPTQELLDWRKRFNIIDGICRGLLYLHRDSRPRIIHRDLKASNILLDKDLNPKISDFGIAKIFGGNEDEANTRRVVGTYGYMSPEYAMEGVFSEKSDVFSFGVLLLEIVSGKRNTSFYSNEEALGLLGYAWKLWDRRDVSSLVDLVISDQRFREEIFRCIHVGLLCVQEYPQHRPAVSTAISMLNSEIVDLPIPKPPGFSGRNFVIDKELIPQNYSSCSINSVTLTEVASR